MRQYRTEETKVIDKIICNRCGKEIAVSGSVPESDTLFVEKRWGYFSDKDNEVHSFDLCEACYDEWIAGFRIPVERK